eukprot:TRINITY_DN5921_c0_g1_i1.p1 TRINITY_DN5921_c0_g1~~TRINITY_DN5921_c0_g1_i1.p1  ORF type:complete len:907 (+),score=113.38 TRINITY_DN5921_c0_g1_i1:117-2837(+)
MGGPCSASPSVEVGFEGGVASVVPSEKLDLLSSDNDDFSDSEFTNDWCDTHKSWLIKPRSKEEAVMKFTGSLCYVEPTSRVELPSEPGDVLSLLLDSLEFTNASVGPLASPPMDTQISGGTSTTGWRSVSRRSEGQATTSLSRSLTVPSKETEPDPLVGTLLTLRHDSKERIARIVVGTPLWFICWRSNVFQLKSGTLSCMKVVRGHADEMSPQAEFPVFDIDGVIGDGYEIRVHFATAQTWGEHESPFQYLCLRASTRADAEKWAIALRTSASLRLRTALELPSEWDVKTMLSTAEQARLVAKVLCPSDTVSALQRLFDHTHLCKRTKDRGDLDLPVRLEVAQVWLVQNVVAWTRYRQVRGEVGSRAHESPFLSPEVLTRTIDEQAVLKVLGDLDGPSHERFLFHGTSLSAVENITDNDFRLDLAGSHRGTMYGHGLYMAECSSKADEYAEEEEDGLCRMLLCRAALGRVLVDAEVKPDPVDLTHRCKGGYDSLCGDRWTAVGTYRELIVFNSSQVYPQYIVVYRRKMQPDFFKDLRDAAQADDEETLAGLVPHVARLSEMHPDETVQYRLALMVNTHATEILPTLCECLLDDRSRVRRDAATLIGKLGKLARPTVALEQGRQKTHADDAYLEMAKAVLPGLVESLSDPEVKVAQAAAEALSQFDQHVAPVVPSLIRALGRPEVGVRHALIVTLGSLGCAALKALGTIVDFAADDDVDIRTEACVAIGKICINAPMSATLSQRVILPTLLSHLQDPYWSVRAASVTSIGCLGTRARPSIQFLSPLVLDEEGQVRMAAVRAIGKVGKRDPEVRSLLVGRLSDQLGGVRSAAATALGEIGDHSKQAIAGLTLLLDDGFDDACIAAAVTLGMLRKRALSAVPELTRCLLHQNLAMRSSAADALRMISR